MIIGTAGHIDHGKSSLVTALTGRPMDRLAEERRREITIDLNFAPLELGAGQVIGVVDVPGHEDFVRTMVAGASGIDLALLVIAADEGIMPQTEEHLLILEQLGLRKVIPVLTKVDLVEADWLQLVTQEVSERLASSSIEFDAPIAVSARTGVGLEQLRDRLAFHARSVARRAPGDAFRMPVDRVFTLAGVGTVVTGTPWSGRLSVGESVRVLPRGLQGRVRSLGTFGLAVEMSEPGARTAVGITGIERSAIARGDVLVTEELPWTSTSALDVEISLDPTAPRPLSARSRVRFLSGTAEVMARVLPREPIPPGGLGVARLRLENPVVARGEDRFVLRSYSPVVTIGGGKVLDPLPPRRRAIWPHGLAASELRERFPALLQRRPGGIDASLLPILTGLPRGRAAEIAREEPDARLVGQLWMSRAAVKELEERALSLVRRYHRLHPSDPGMPLETLRHSLGARAVMAETALDDSVKAGRLRRIDGVVALAGFVPQVEGGDPEIERIVGILTEAALTPPSVGELEQRTGRRDLHPLLRLAAAKGRVEAVERDRYYSREALDRFTQVLNEMGRQGPISPAAVRDRLGITRKYLIPLLEWADNRGITVREGEGRRLKTKV